MCNRKTARGLSLEYFFILCNTKPFILTILILLICPEQRQSCPFVQNNNRDNDRVRITKADYDKKMQEFTDKLQTLNIEFEEHTKADCDYQTTVATVFSLARRAKQIFDSSEIHEKRAFLNYLFQNPTVKEKTLVFTLRSPFDLVLQTAHQPVRQGLADMFGTFDWPKLQAEMGVFPSIAIRYFNWSTQLLTGVNGIATI